MNRDDRDAYLADKQAYLAVLELPHTERDRWLDRQIDDPSRRDRIRAMLDAMGDDPDATDASASDGSPATMPTTLGPYRLLEELGRGATGTVYLARRHEAARGATTPATTATPDDDSATADVQPVALKILHQHVAFREFQQRFERERDVLARLDHPGIARLVDAGRIETTTGPLAYLAMEYVPGDGLREYLELETPDRRTRLQLLADLADALTHAHARGVTHRDLKPQNIRVDPDGRPRILDFGVARLADTDLETLSLVTQPGELVGTVRYMSPEQARGEEATPASDVYALGLIAHEVLVGALPYDVPAEPLHHALLTVATADAPPPSRKDPTVRGAIDAVIATALEPRPADRYQDAGAMATDLRACADRRPISVRGPGARARLRRWARSRRVRLTLAALLVAAVALVSAWLGRDASSGAMASEARRAAIYAALDGADRYVHFESRTREGLHAALDSLESAAARLGAERAMPGAAALRRYLELRRGEAFYFLGHIEHDPARFVQAVQAFDEAQHIPFDRDELAALRPDHPVTARIREDNAVGAVSRSALAYAASADYARPRQNLLDAVDKAAAARRHHLRLGTDGYWPDNLDGPGMNRAIIHNDLARYFARLADVTGVPAFSDSSLVHFREVNQADLMKGNPPAYGSFLHGFGMAWRVRHRLTGEPAALDSALARLSLALSIRTPNLYPGSHARTRCELAEVRRARRDHELALDDLALAWSALDPAVEVPTAGRVLRLRAGILLDRHEASGDTAAWSTADSLLATAADLLPPANFPLDAAWLALARARCDRLSFEPGGLARAKRRLELGRQIVPAGQHPELARSYAEEAARVAAESPPREPAGVR